MQNTKYLNDRKSQIKKSPLPHASTMGQRFRQWRGEQELRVELAEKAPRQSEESGVETLQDQSMDNVRTGTAAQRDT